MSFGFMLKKINRCFLCKILQVFINKSIIIAMNKFWNKNNSLKTSRFSHSQAMTMAEVLITLGVIGVVAAMTIPNLISSYQKDQTATQLKKVYTSLSQVVKQSEADNGPSKYWYQGIVYSTDAVQQSFDTYWAPYIKVLKICEIESDCGYTSNYYKYLSGTEDTMIIVYPTYRTTLILPDGVILIISPYYGLELKKYIFVDLNGAKKPNMYGKDVFWFVMAGDKGLMPYGYEQIEANINGNCKKNGVGTYCATKIMRDGWQMEGDYPW